MATEIIEKITSPIARYWQKTSSGSSPPTLIHSNENLTVTDPRGPNQLNKSVGDALITPQRLFPVHYQHLRKLWLVTNLYAATSKQRDTFENWRRLPMYDVSTLSICRGNRSVNYSQKLWNSGLSQSRPNYQAISNVNNCHPHED